MHNRQPMETLKTLTQVKTKGQSSSLFATATNLYSTAGIRGFYRGGVPLLLGGGLMVRHYNIVPHMKSVFSAIRRLLMLSLCNFSAQHNSVYVIP